jgi:sugar phosphate isomerase/epimerase
MSQPPQLDESWYLKMELKLFKTLWGHSDSFETACASAADAGFDGLEAPSSSSRAVRSDYRSALADYDLLYIAEITTAGSYVPEAGLDAGAHFDSFQQKLEQSLELDPILVNCLAGSDLWTFSDTVDFFHKALPLAQRCGAAVAFETHRSRSLFHPLVTTKLLHEIPELQLTIDFSHWCCVCERLVMDELPYVLELCAKHARHIHARIGYDQGPQVPDPRAPEYAPALLAHERWWNWVWIEMELRKFSCATMTPEFGPDGYLHLEPFSQRPVADLWEVNRWIGQREKARFQQRKAAISA